MLSNPTMPCMHAYYKQWLCINEPNGYQITLTHYRQRLLLQIQRTNSHRHKRHHTTRQDKTVIGGKEQDEGVSVPSDREERKQLPCTPKQLLWATPKPPFSESSLKTTSCNTETQPGDTRWISTSLRHDMHTWELAAFVYSSTKTVHPIYIWETKNNSESLHMENKAKKGWKTKINAVFNCSRWNKKSNYPKWY